MDVFKIVISVILIINCIICTIAVLLQEGKSAGLGALSGSSDTYWSKNKGRSTEGLLANVTKVCAVIFFILCIALNLKWFN